MKNDKPTSFLVYRSIFLVYHLVFSGFYFFKKIEFLEL
jgi:hypothetical protein